MRTVIYGIGTIVSFRVFEDVIESIPDRNIAVEFLNTFTYFTASGEVFIGAYRPILVSSSAYILRDWDFYDELNEFESFMEHYELFRFIKPRWKEDKIIME